MSALFVTGTGTDIGKTFVAAGLIRQLRAAGCVVDALKPVVSGFDPAAPQGSDPAVLLDALGRPATPEGIARIAPWRYRAPLSPNMAARLEGRPLDVEALVAFCRARIDAASGPLLIEGPGGAMVPLDDRCTVLDWIAVLRVPVLVVGGSYLGAISHALTALQALQARGLAVRAYVVSESASSTVPLDATVATLAHFTDGVPVLAVPRDPAGHAEAFARIAAACFIDRA